MWYGAAFRKLISICRSTSHTSESEVVCLITFVTVQATREIYHGYRIFRVWNWRGPNECDIFHAIIVFAARIALTFTKQQCLVEMFVLRLYPHYGIIPVFLLLLFCCCCFFVCLFFLQTKSSVWHKYVQTLRCELTLTEKRLQNDMNCLSHKSTLRLFELFFSANTKVKCYG